MSTWLANLHQSMQGKDIGEEGANVITRVLIQQIENAEKEFQPQSLSWESDAIGALRLCIRVEEGSKAAQAYVLALIQKHWDELSKEFRKEYDYQFDVLVMRETGIQPSTMDNYTRAADTFFIKKMQPLGSVEVPVYDQFRKPVKKDGVVVTKHVDFDATRISITKLTLARPAVEANRMTPKLWSMLVDKEVTVDALKKEMYSTTTGNETGKVEDPSLRFRLQGNVIVAREFGEEVEIAELFWDMGDTELGRTAIRRLLIALQIPFEEDVIAKIMQQARETMILRVYENGGEGLLDGNNPNK